MRRLGVVVLVLAMVAAACGSGDDAGESTSAPSSSTTAGTTTTTLPAGLGTEWARVDDPEGVFGGPDTQAMRAVTVSETGVLVGVGSDGDTAAMWLSEDGLIWERVPHDPDVLEGEIGSQGMSDIVDGPQGLTVVGHDFAYGAVWLLTGSNMIRIPHADGVFGGSPNQSMRAVASGGPGLVAVGSSYDPLGGMGTADAVVWTSFDGLLWNRLPHNDVVFGGGDAGSMITTDQRMYDVATGPGTIVAVGEDDHDAAIWVSDDGESWSRAALDDEVFDDADLTAVVAGGPGFVAVGQMGEDAAVWTSEDGREWVGVPGEGAGFGGPGKRIMYAMAVGGPGLVAVGGVSSTGIPSFTPAVWTSADGITWERAPDLGFESGDYMTDVVAGGPGLVAVGYVNTDDSEWDAAVWVSPPPG